MAKFIKSIWHLLPARIRHLIGHTAADIAYPMAMRTFDLVMDHWYGVNTRRDQHDIHIADARRNVALYYARLITIRE